MPLLRRWFSLLSAGGIGGFVILQRITANAGSVSSIAVTFANPTQAGSRIICVSAMSSGNVSPSATLVGCVTDNNGNTYTNDVAQRGSASPASSAVIASCTNVAAKASHTVTVNTSISASTGEAVIEIFEISPALNISSPTVFSQQSGSPFSVSFARVFCVAVCENSGSGTNLIAQTTGSSDIGSTPTAGLAFIARMTVNFQAGGVAFTQGTGDFVALSAKYG